MEIELSNLIGLLKEGLINDALKEKKWWRWRESNPRPKIPFSERLHT